MAKKNKYWHDPVWSKLIAGLMHSAILAVLAFIGLMLSSYFGGLSMSDAANHTLVFLLSKSAIGINKGLLLVIIIVLIAFTIQILKGGIDL